MILRESFETHYCLPSVTFKLSPDPMENRPIFNHLQISKNGERFVFCYTRPTNDSIANRLSGEMERPVFVCGGAVYPLNIKGFFPLSAFPNSDWKKTGVARILRILRQIQPYLSLFLCYFGRRPF